MSPGYTVFKLFILPPISATVLSPAAGVQCILLCLQPPSILSHVLMSLLVLFPLLSLSIDRSPFLLHPLFITCT